jgi:hypothetical protein
MNPTRERLQVFRIPTGRLTIECSRQACTYSYEFVMLSTLGLVDVVDITLRHLAECPVTFPEPLAVS